MPSLPPGIFTNYSPAPASGAVNILLLDALNTPLADQAYVRQQLLDYLRSTPPGTRVAFFGLANHLILLQGFTSNPEVLRTLMERGWNKASPHLCPTIRSAAAASRRAWPIALKTTPFPRTSPPPT